MRGFVEPNRVLIMDAINRDDAVALSAFINKDNMDQRFGRGHGIASLLIVLVYEHQRALRCLAWMLNLGVAIPPDTLHHLARRNHVDGIRILLDSGRIRVNDVGRYGGTPLDFLSLNKSVSHAGRYLLWRGATCSPPMSPAYEAIINGRNKCRATVRALLGARRYQRSAMLNTSDAHMTMLIARHLWDTRLCGAWSK